MIISHVVAVGRNGVIGNKGAIPWKCPEDLQHFKNITIGGTVLMGRLTHMSIGRDLPNRHNIVVSRNDGYVLHDHIMGLKSEGCPELFIIGGGQIYRQTIDMVDRIYITKIRNWRGDGDTFYSYDEDKFIELFEETTDQGEWSRLLLKRKI